MSNTIVPSVYGHIIKEVIINSQKDFEENGVDVGVLQELEKLWETKLSNSSVANFESFVPKVIVPQTSVSFTPATEQYAKYFEQYTNQELDYTQTRNETKPEIQTPEVKYNQIINQIPPSAEYNAANLPNLAHATASSLPTLPHPLESYAQTQTQAQTQTRLPVYQQPDYYKDTKPSAQGLPQLDGSDDFDMKKWEEFKRLFKNKYSQKEADENLNQKIEEIYKKNTLPQLDGEAGEPDADVDADLKEEDDEDAINSDLDDSDEGDGEDGDKDNTEHIILCQYDKVSRTKNRWRCSLKDGIILVNGKEYLFNKATGEFQW